jgi:hypothetical protein
MSRPRWLVRLAAASAAAVVLLPAAPAAASDPVSPGASAYSAAADTGSGALTSDLLLTGAIGKLIDPIISPIVHNAIDPLLGALTASVNSLAAKALGVSSNATAGTPTQQYGTPPATFPTDTAPTPCVSTGAQPCFGIGANPAAIAAPPLVTVGLGAASGYTQQVPQTVDDTTISIFGRAHVEGPSITLLPAVSSALPLSGDPLVPAVSVVSADAKANCPNDCATGDTKPKTAPTALASASQVRLLGGLIGFDVQSGQITNLVIDGTGYSDISQLPVLNISGITVQSFRLSLEVTVPLTATQVFKALNLPDSVVSQLLSLDPSSTMALTLIVGPHTSITSTTAIAWGLGIAADLSGKLQFNLLDLVGAQVTVPSGITGPNLGNLLDLRLAYATCQSGVTTPPKTAPIPPSLV